MPPASPPVTTRVSDAAPERDRRAERLRSLHLVEIPRIRFAGYALLSVAVLVHNLLVFGSGGPWLVFAVAAMSYAILAGLLLQVLHYRVTRFDPAIIFLAADLPFWALAIYVTGAERSWIFFVMVLRAADQTITSVRRAVIFAHLATVMYAAVIAYVVLVDGRAVAWAPEIAKTLSIYAASLYISLIARTGERHRKKRADAQRLAEDLSRTARRQQQLLRRIFDATSDALVFISPEGRIESGNDRAGELLGFIAAEAGGLDATEVVGAGLHAVTDGTPFGRVLGSLIANPADAQGNIRDQGSNRILHWHATPTRDLSGALIGLTVTLQDITRSQELIGQLEANARMLEAARRRAEEASGGQAEFLANITHELRTPLAAIIGLAQLALESDGAAQREHLRRMQINAESLLASINDILDYSKMDAGRIELERIPFGLRALLEDVLDSLSSAAEDKGLELTRRVEGDVPDRVVGDPVRLRQILMNLVGNGVKFTEHGGVNVRVRLAAQAGSTLTLHVEVTDSGIGIPADKQQLVFEAFAQADGSTTRKYGGTGLGLSIASKLVSLMGGALWVESEAGHGSRFHFTVVLAAHESPRGDSVIVASEPAARSAERALMSARRVLMADDSPLHRELLSHLLRARGYEVVTAANGREAIDAFTTSKIDAVILDWQMPEMDGLQTTQAIRRAERPGARRVPIVAATAAVRPEDRSRGIATGVDCFLTKPIPTAMLLAVLESGRPVTATPRQELDAGREELLARLGDAELARRLIDLFLGEGPRLLGELRAALDRKDPDGLRRSAHGLHGAIANFPIAGARDIAAEMERRGLAGDFDAAERLFPDLQDAVRQLSLQLPALF